MSNEELHIDGDFTLNIPHFEADFTENEQPKMQADFNINVAPTDYINEINGGELIDVQKDGKTVTLQSKTFIFEQGIASDTWQINHNLNKYPSCTIVDSSGLQFQPQINYIDENNLIASMNGATTGKAFLN